MIEIIPARPQDAISIVNVIRSEFSAAILKMIIYGCEGMSNYIQDQINARKFGTDTIYTIAIVKNKIIGCVELRLLQETLFLNYIALIKDFQGQGLARKLLLSAINQAGGWSCKDFALDVFDYNKMAIEWYKRMGLEKVYTADWYEVPINLTKKPVESLIIGYPIAEACHKRFQFSQFSLLTKRSVYTVGRLNKEWFRLTQTEALSDPDFLPTLYNIDPYRKLMVLVKEGNSKPSDFLVKKLLTIERMSIDLQKLILNLEKNIKH